MEDAKRAIHLYGPDVAVIRGRSVNNRSYKITKPKIIELPKKLIPKNLEVHLYVKYVCPRNAFSNHNIQRFQIQDSRTPSERKEGQCR